MSQEIKAVLFDVDGTLLDKKFIYETFYRTLADVHGITLTPEAYDPFWGISLAKTYRGLTGLEDVEELCLYHSQYQPKILHTVEAYSNSLHTLTTLKADGFKIAAVTSRGNPGLTETLQHTGLFDLFDVITGAHDVTEHKPHPEPINRTLGLLGLSPEQTIMVGDSDVDIISGQRAGTLTAGATYGAFGQRIRQCNPNYIIDDISEIIPLAKQTAGRTHKYTV